MKEYYDDIAYAVSDGMRYENLLCEYLTWRGYESWQPRRAAGEPDPGDVHVMLPRGLQVIDVKHARDWTSDAFPYRNIMLAQESKLHLDWWYVIFKPDGRAFYVVRPEIIPPGAYTKKTTRNACMGVEQVSVQVPLSFARLKKDWWK